MTSQCFDAATWENLPLRSQLMLYGDGDYAAPPTAAKQLDAIAVRYITVTGDYRGCGAIDWEPNNPCFTPGTLRSYVRGRRALNVMARVYCDRANAAEAIAALRDFGNGSLLSYNKLFWWISTLDNHEWSAVELAAELTHNWDAPILPQALWGNQFATGSYDTSTVYGRF
jgi:hypothetical protein